MHPKQNTPTTLVANAVESPDPRSVLQTPSLTYVWSPVDSLAQGKHMGGLPKIGGPKCSTLNSRVLIIKHPKIDYP